MELKSLLIGFILCGIALFAPPAFAQSTNSGAGNYSYTPPVIAYNTGSILETATGGHLPLLQSLCASYVSSGSTVCSEWDTSIDIGALQFYMNGSARNMDAVLGKWVIHLLEFAAAMAVIRYFWYLFTQRKKHE